MQERSVHICYNQFYHYIPSLLLLFIVSYSSIFSNNDIFFNIENNFTLFPLENILKVEIFYQFFYDIGSLKKFGPRKISRTYQICKSFLHMQTL